MNDLSTDGSHVALRITRRTKTLVICIFRSRFMARTLYKGGACHDFVRPNVMRKHAVLQLATTDKEKHESNCFLINGNIL